MMFPATKRTWLVGAALTFTAAVLISKVAAAEEVDALESWRDCLPAELQGFETLDSSRVRGRLLFASDRVSCSGCHSVERDERIIGPSLFAVGTRLSRGQIVTSIIEPSREISEENKTWRVELVSGRMHSVARISPTPAANEPNLVKANGQEIRISRRDIASSHVEESPMPTGTVSHLASQEFADLIAFLTSLTHSDSAISAR